MAVENDDLATLLTSASLVTVGSILGSSSKLVERIILARMLPDAAAYGQVSVGISLMTISVTVALVGLEHGVARFVPRYETDHEKRGTWLSALVIAVSLSVGVVAVLMVTHEWLVSNLFGEDPSSRLVVYFILAIPFVAGMRVAIATIQGFENTIYRTYSKDLLYNGFRIALLVVLLVVGVGIASAGAAYLVSAAVTFVVAHFLLNRLISLRGEYSLHARELMTFSAPLMISAFVSVLLAQSDTLMLGYFGSSVEVARYNAAYPLAVGQSVILSSFGFMYYPLTTRLDADGKLSEIKALYKVTTKWTFVVGFPLFVLLLVFSEDLIRALFGAQYTGGALALSILTVGIFTKAAIGRCQDTITAFGFTRAILVINTSAFALNVALNLLLIPAYGDVGAAVASAISFLGLNGLAFAVMYWKSGVHPFSHWTVRTFVVLPLVLLPAAYLFSLYVELSLVTIPLVGIALTVLTVVVLALSGSLQSEDEVALELIEGAVGVRIPLVRRFIPDEDVEVDFEV